MSFIQSFKEFFSSAAMEERIQKEQSLYEACSRGDVEKVKSLLDSGVSVNAKNKVGYYAICNVDNPEVLKFFIAKGGIDQKALDKALYVICLDYVINNYEEDYEQNADLLECAKLQLGAGASVNAKDVALLAIENAAVHKEMLDLFLAKGGLEQKSLNIALYSASMHKNEENVNSLLKNGADPRILHIHDSRIDDAESKLEKQQKIAELYKQYAAKHDKADNQPELHGAENTNPLDVGTSKTNSTGVDE